MSLRAHLGPAAAAVLLAACGSSTSGGSTTSPATSAPTTAAPTTATAMATSRPAITELRTATTSLGQVVTDGAGSTLYMFTRDTQSSTTSACTGACLVAWPPVVAETTPKLTGITGAVASIATADGRRQVTLNGWPLYYYAKDTKAGDVTGQNVNQVWFVLTAAGEPVKG